MIIVLGVLFFLNFESDGQDYLRLKNNPNSNFIEIQKSANEYFDKVGKGKGTGYKQYKRWEYENISSSYPSGNLLLSGPDLARKEFDSFRSENRWKSTKLASWESLGPDNINTNNGHYSPGLGRIDRIAIDPKNDNTLYIGGPTNGVWKSVDGGLHWTSKTDNVGALGVSSIVIDPINTDKLYWSTGDGDDNTTNCTGIYISDDGGETWAKSGLTFPFSQGVKGRKLIMDPTNSNTLLFSSSLGIYKSTNGGLTWVLKTGGNFDDLFYKTDDSQIVYASKPDEFYRSVDGGESFTKVNIGLEGRVFISLTPAAPDDVYIMTGQKGIYKSTDKGQNFSFIADHKYTKGNMWHHGTFIVSPNNANLIHTGEFETHRSNDGGYSWIKTSTWTYPTGNYIHCDIHEFVYAGNKLYVCTDGGVSYTTNEGNTWTNLFNTMVALEPYRMTVCKSNSNLHMNGSQDNGIYLWDGKRWDGIYGADGMECLIDYENPNNKYFAIQDGSVYAVGKTITQPGSGDWVSPMVMHPTNPLVIFFGNANVKKTEDGMQSWKVIGSFGNGNVNMLAIGESNPDYIYASKGSRIWRTSNGGTLWTEVSAGLPNLWITRIAVHPNDPLKIAVSLGGYSLGEKVYTSTDGGTNWQNVSKNLPNIKARCLVYDNLPTGALYLGMDLGIYYIDNTLSDWELYCDNFPLVGVNDLKIHDESDQIYAASLGRGIWKSMTKNAPANCSASGNSETGDDWIKQVELESISNISGKNYYEDYTNLFTTLSPGSTYNLKVTLNNHSIGDKCFAWIDTNNNRQFENSELIDFGDFNGAHLAIATFTIAEETKPGYFTMRVRNQNENNVANACGDAIKGEVEDYSILVETPVREYCNASGSAGTTSDWIKNVTLNTLNNTSEKSSYSDFTHLSTDLIAGTEYTISVTLNYHWDPDICGAWIDYNNNYVFDENEYIEIPIANAAIHKYKGRFTIPSSAISGKVRMRVRAVYNASLLPCSNLFGEVEDYSVVIKGTTPIDGITQSIISEIKVYPNPASTILKVELLSFSNKQTILQIYNVKGELVEEKSLGYQKFTRINTSSYPSGLYFIKAVNNKSAVYTRFIVP